jgi:cell division protein ZapA
MSNVNLSIGGKSFTVACAEGEEGHVTGLGEMIDGKLAAMGDMTGQSESRLLLFAALLLADDLHEAERRAVAVVPPPAPPPAAAPPPISAYLLESIADRLENLASRLES